MADLSLGPAGSGPGPEPNMVGISDFSDVRRDGKAETLVVSGGDAVVTGGSFAAHLVMKEKDKDRGLELELGLASGLQVGDENKGVRSLDSVLGAEKNGEDGVEKIATRSDPTGSLWDGSSTKLAFDGNGISLVVDVHGPLKSVNENKKKLVKKDNKDSLTHYEGAPTGKYAERASSISKVAENEVNGNGEEDGGHVGEDNGESDEVDGGEDMGSEEHYEYSVGDFVWGKIKSRPWWPGQIYDSFDASDHAAKHKQMGRHLVAYFGDGSFSWCLPSQLKHFRKNFEGMSKQSNSRSFINAVQKALNEFGRRVELVMTCLCVSEGNTTRLTRPLAMNTGNKAGTLVPKEGFNKLPICQYEPSELLARLRYLAQALSVASMLEVTLLKSWLSAFYSVKRKNYWLPIYQEPHYIEGLEDQDRNENLKINEFGIPLEAPIQGPYEEDWLYLPGSSEKYPAITEEKLKQRWKRKSVAELMKEDMNKGSADKSITLPGRRTSGKKKTKGYGKDGSHSDIILTSPSGREQQRKKKAESSGNMKPTENKVLSVENSNNRGEAAGSESPLSRKRKGKDVSGIEINDRKEAEYVSSPRERKKSRYLSPPYTSLKWSTRKSGSKRDLDLESGKTAKVVRMGEQMTKAARQLFESLPILSNSVEAFKKSPPKEHGKCSRSSHKTAEKNHKSIVDSMEVNASVGEVLSEVQSAAVDPVCRRRRLDLFKGLLGTFRSSVYVNGSYYNWYNKHLLDRKGKSLTSERGQWEKDMHETDNELAKPVCGVMQIGREPKRKVGGS